MDQDNKNTLITSLEEAIFNNHCSMWKTVLECTENNFDAIIDNPIIKNIPFVSVVTSLIKVGYDVRSISLLKNTFIFIEELNSPSTDQEKIRTYRKRIEGNYKYLYRELENVLIYLDRITEPVKAKYLAAVYKEYIYEHISFTEMRDFFSVTDRLFISDLDEIKRVLPKGGITVGDDINDSDLRLLFLGIFKEDNRLSHSGFLSGRNMSDFALKFSEMGRKYATIICGDL